MDLQDNSVLARFLQDISGESSRNSKSASFFDEFCKIGRDFTGYLQYFNNKNRWNFSSFEMQLKLFYIEQPFFHFTTIFGWFGENWVDIRPLSVTYEHTIDQRSINGERVDDAISTTSKREIAMKETLDELIILYQLGILWNLNKILLQQ